MNVIYRILDLIPFSFIQSDFMKNALLAILFSSVLFGLIGTAAVDNKMAFFSDALGHSAMTGVALGVILGVRNELICLIAFGVLMALLISRVKAGAAASADTIISVFSSTSLAFGLLLLSKYQSISKYASYLAGDVLSITQTELVMLFVALVAVAAIWVVIYNKLLLLSINPTLAASRGIRVGLYENLFAVIIAVVVMLSVKWVGILLINSLLILPASAARNISRSTRQYHALSILFALISGVSGLILSWYIGASTGATIVVISAVLFFVTFFIRKFRMK